MKIDVRCQTCGEETEPTNHVLFTCSLARHVWALSGIPTPRLGFNMSSLYANFQFLYEIFIDKRLDLIKD